MYVQNNYVEWIKNNLALTLSLIAFFWIFLLSYHIPWIYNDEDIIMKEAAKGFSFPEGQILSPRFAFMYAYKAIFFVFGFNYFYFHLFKAMLVSVLIYFYFKVVSKFVGEKLGAMACFALLFTSPFVFTSIWISEQITMALTLQAIMIYLLLFAKKNFKNYLLLFALLFAAIFSKETNLILLPILAYYFIIQNNVKEKLLCLIPVLFALFYRLLITTRPVRFDISNFLYFQNVLAKYFTFVLPLIVLLYAIHKIFSAFKSKDFLKCDNKRFLVVWYVLSLIMLLFGHDKEERYIVEILPVFLILSIVSLKNLFEITKARIKLFNTIVGLIFIYFITINGYGIIKIEYGWGNMYAAFEEISQTIDSKYPDSLILYPSATQDFFSVFRKYEVLAVTSDFNVSSLDNNSSKYNKIFYIQYPERIRQFAMKDLKRFNNLFNVTKGLYTFEVYELNLIHT